MTGKDIEPFQNRKCLKSSWLFPEICVALQIFTRAPDNRVASACIINPPLNFPVIDKPALDAAKLDPD